QWHSNSPARGNSLPQSRRSVVRRRRNSATAPPGTGHDSQVPCPRWFFQGRVSMRLSAVLKCAAFASMLTVAGAVLAAPNSPPQVSEPVRHANLAVYFIRGVSSPGAVPLTLEEALAKGVAQVRETSNVNSLEIENTGDAPVFVQAGDIVKGGKQDCSLMVSLLLPPKSGRIPIASFCVEHGRWSQRENEDAGKFSASTSSVPSREMKLAMQAPMAKSASVAALDETNTRQQKVWDGVQT